MKLRIYTCVAAVALLAACGDDGEGTGTPARCGPGLTLFEGECVAVGDDAGGGDTTSDTGGDTGDTGSADTVSSDVPETGGGCTIGERICNADQTTVLECRPEVGFVEVEVCDALAFEACAGGECAEGCAAVGKTPSYIGCEYWSVDLPQYADPFGDPRAIPHAVVFGNVSPRPAEIIVEAGVDVPMPTSTMTVPSGQTRVFTFPRLDVENSTRSLRSFRIASSEPVIAYQFNPLNNVGVASNDASLLLPSSALGTEYYVASWGSGVGGIGFEPQNGWFTIVGVTEQTRVTITFSADIIDGPDFQGITAGSTHNFVIGPFEVLNFEAKSELEGFTSTIGDMTGTHIVSSAPVVVFGGHEEAIIGERDEEDRLCCADHMEQQMFPVDTWRNEVLAVHSPPRGNEPDIWRIVASQNGTTITTDPPVAGLNGVTLNAGQFAEAEALDSFVVSASAPVMVVQYLVSQQDARITSTKGDPAMILAVPTEQYRNEYVVLTPEDYSEDWLTVVRPAGVRVMMDGAPLADTLFQPVAGGTWQVAYVSVEPGRHSLDTPGEEGFGVYGFGYSGAVSYGYPGGLDLARPTVETPQ